MPTTPTRTGTAVGTRSAISRLVVALAGAATLAVVGTAGMPSSAQESSSTTAPTSTETTATTAAETTSTAAETTTTAPSSTETTATTAPSSTETTATTAPSSTETTATTASTTSTTAGTDSTTTTAAGTGTTAARPATEAERDRLQQAESQKAREIDAANAQLDDLTNALAVLQADVDAQAAEVEIAAQRVATAQQIADAATEDVAALEAKVRELEYGLSDQAIRSFKGDLLADAVITVGSDPNQSMRMQGMLAKATQSDIDFVTELASTREDLLARRADADEAVAIAAESQEESEAELAALEEDRLAQGRLNAAAESRLDHLLSERAALAQIGADYDAGQGGESALVEQLANSSVPIPAVDIDAPGTVTEADIRLAGNGIEVHVSIVGLIRQLLADAAADGVLLAGGGYRDPAGQIAVRRNNCGTSNYAIYEMPSSQCSPPTARPGRSMHEQGKAIDFTYNGKLIRSRSGAGWAWLRDNAHRYGLKNLPSEPWHWSTNGR